MTPKLTTTVEHVPCEPDPAALAEWAKRYVALVREIQRKEDETEPPAK